MPNTIDIFNHTGIFTTFFYPLKILIEKIIDFLYEIRNLSNILRRNQTNY